MSEHSDTSIVFVDGSLADLDAVIDGIGPEHQVYVVEPGVNGVEFMASVLADESDVSAVHVISHGSEGEFRLGSAHVNSQSIAVEYAEALADISDALAEGADFLIYGCNFGADEGTVAALADVLGADVAASNDLTGHASFGGDWELEVESGEIEASTALTREGQDNWNGILGNFSLDWGSLVWNDGDLTNTYTLTGSTGQMVDVTITVAEITNSPVPFTFNSIEYPAEDPVATGSAGNIHDLLIATDPTADAPAQLSISVAFTEGGSGAGGPAVNLDAISFQITDIDWRQDTGNNSQDQVTVTSDGNVMLSEVNTADNTVAISGNTAYADVQGHSSNDDRGSVNVNISDGATGFTIVYEDIIATGEPSVRGIGVLGGFSFSGSPSPDTNTTVEDTPLVVDAASGVLANDSDTSGSLVVHSFTVDGISGTFNAGETVIMAEGNLTLNGDGSYVFVPFSGFSGSVPQVIYTVHDGASVEAAALDITVTPLSSGPVWNISGPLHVNEGDTAGYTLSLVNQHTLSPGQSVSVDLSLADLDTTSADYAGFVSAVATAAASDPNYALVGSTLTYTEPAGSASGYTQTFTPGGASGVTSIVGQPGTVALNLGDDQTSSQSIGFDFNFFGTGYSSISVDSNGYVTFGGAPGSTYDNGDLAAGTALGGNPAIAAFWDDLSPNQAGDVYVRTTGSPGSRKFIVEWSDVPYYNGGNTDGGTFQLVLDEATGTVEIHYLDVDFNGAGTSNDNALSATLGIQDGSGTGLEFSQDTAVSNLSGATLTYAPPVAPAPYSPLTIDLGTVDDPGYEGGEDYQITLSNAGGGSSIGLGSVTTTIVDNESPPVATDNSNIASEDGPTVMGNVLTDGIADSDLDGDSLSVIQINGVPGDVGNQIALPSGALVTLNSDGTYSYDPNGQYESLGSGQSASDQFTYTISDGTGGTDTATVTIVINGENDAPVKIIDQPVNTYYDTMINCGFWSHAGVVAGSVLVDLDNVVDPDVNDTHTFTIVNGAGVPVADPDFEIVNNELVIRAGSSLTPGVIANRSVIVRVDDGNGGIHDRTYTFDLELDTGSYAGSAGNDFVFGTTGADTVTGGAGMDRLFGDDGDDTLQGEAGNDLLDGGAGADTLDGGDGVDGASYMSAESGVVADLANSAANTGDAAGDTYVNMEMLWGSTLGDTLSGDAGDNVLVGHNGDDVLVGRGGNDNLYGGLGNDTLIIGDGDGNDTVYAFSTGAGSEDVVNLFDLGFSSFEEVQAAMSVVDGHVVLQLDENDSLRFHGISSIADLHEDDFIL